MPVTTLRCGHTCRHIIQVTWADQLGGEHGAAATAEDEPEGAEELGAEAGGKLGGVHFCSI